jgi:hypothetical protein
MAHTCNPSYSGGRDQKVCGSKPAWANSSQDPILEKPNIKRAGDVAQGVGPKFRPHYCKNKQTKKPKGPGLLLRVSELIFLTLKSVSV